MSTRGASYTESEKQMLLALAYKHLNIIENKSLSKETTAQKGKIWNHLTRQYNAVATTGERTSTQLRTLYSKIKNNKTLLQNEIQINDSSSDMDGASDTNDWLITTHTPASDNTNTANKATICIDFCETIFDPPQSRNDNAEMSYSDYRKAPFFTPRERQTLLEIIDKYKDVLDDKRIGAKMNQKKKACWALVASQYNANAVTGPRRWQQIKRLYTNIKMRNKEKLRSKGVSQTDSSDVNGSSDDSNNQTSSAETPTLSSENVATRSAEKIVNRTEPVKMSVQNINDLCGSDERFHMRDHMMENVKAFVTNENAKKTPKFDENEKQLFLEIANKFKHILNCKPTREVIPMKRKIWHIITKEFNTVTTSNLRSVTQLRNLHRNIKSKLKKEAPELYEEMNETNDAVYDALALSDDAEETVISSLGDIIDAEMCSFSALAERECERNISRAEKQLFLNIIETNNYKEILDCKKIDAENNAKKSAAWDNVAREYNLAAVSGPRSVRQLQRLYQNIKYRSKEADKSTSQSVIEVDKSNGVTQDDTRTEQNANSTNISDAVDAIMSLKCDTNCNNNYDTEMAAEDTLNAQEEHTDGNSNAVNAEPDDDDDDDDELITIADLTSTETSDNNPEEGNTVHITTEPEVHVMENINGAISEDNTTNQRSDIMKIIDKKIATKPAPKKKMKKSMKLYKESYFKAKFRNAELEKHLLLTQIRNAREKHKIIMEIYSTKLKKMQSQINKK